MISIREAIKIYSDHGGKFFDKDTMRFWNSRVVSDLFPNNCFVTSEDNYNRTETLFSVRQFSDDFTQVETIGFQLWDTAGGAIEFAKQL